MANKMMITRNVFLLAVILFHGTFALLAESPLINQRPDSFRKLLRAATSRVTLLSWQTPHFFDFAESLEHLVIFLIDGFFFCSA